MRGLLKGSGCVSSTGSAALSGQHTSSALYAMKSQLPGKRAIGHSSEMAFTPAVRGVVAGSGSGSGSGSGGWQCGGGAAGSIVRKVCCRRYSC